MKIDYWQNFEEGKIYHIYNRAVEKTNLFNCDRDYQYFLSKFNVYFGHYVDIFAYCLIPNHFHFLIRVKSITEIKDALQYEKTKAAKSLIDEKADLNKFLCDQARRFFSSYVNFYNKKYERRGHLFIQRFKRVSVSEGRFTYLLCYIHHNPIHHHLVNNYADWKYSSYNLYYAIEPTILNRAYVLDWLHGMKKFEEYHRQFKIDKKEEY